MKKIIFICLIALGSSLTMDAQSWTVSGSTPKTLYVDSSSYRVAVGTGTGLGKLRVQETGADPSTGSTPNGHLNLTTTSLANSFGVGSGYSWIQSRALESATTYTLSLNPLGGNVGIRTISPTYILSLGNEQAQKIWIENTASGTVGRDLTFSAGSTVAGTNNITGGELFLQSGLGTGTGASTISFQTGTTYTATGTAIQPYSTKMTILGNGNVGIGTTTPTYQTVIQNSGAAVLALTSGIGTTDYAQIFFGNTNAIPLGRLRFNNSDTSFQFILNTAQKMHINSNGDVGIGTTTPRAKLDVLATTGDQLRVSYSTSSYVKTTVNATGTTTIQGIGSTSSSTIIGGNQVGSQCMLQSTSANGTATGVGIMMMVGNNGANHALNILNNGKVGIGTEAPDGSLHVVGVASASYPATSGSTQTGLISRLQNTGSTFTMDIGGNGGNGGWIQATNSTNLATNYKLMLNPNGGNVGIGTTSPGVLFQVGNASDGTVAKANAWNTFSDANFKTNVETINNALKKVLSLRGVTFDWVACKQPSIGFIAQEVEMVLPSIVNTDTITGFKSLDYSKIVPVLVECIKQLDSTNTALAKKDSIKNSKIQALEATDSILKAKLQNQDTIVASLQDQINQLTTTINKCCSMLTQPPADTNPQAKSLSESITTQTDVTLIDAQSIVLEQNVPNPFAEQTTINYFLPNDVVKAQMLFYNAEGKLIQTATLTNGKGILNVFAQDLTNGIYSYTLVVDGKIVETKKMVKQ